ncbi:MAG: type II toxin-antitoxin system HipA family toxin [Candidatus Binatia bacterium]
MITAAVMLWGRRIGAVTWSATANLASFEYDPEFRSSGIEVSPIVMPLDARIHQFPGLPREAFKGLPGMLADSLPDRYGHALIDAWLARQGRQPASFSPVERLCYVGTRGMGALEYHPARGPGASADDLDVARLVELADAVLAERASLNANVERDEKAIDQVLQVGTSAGGVRAKAIIAWNPETQAVRSGQGGLDPGFAHWILKLDGVRSTDEREVGTGRGYGLVEYAYHRMALRAGLTMNECRLLEEGGRHHFMTRRFDRTESGKKIHMQSLAALGHYDFNAAGSYSYEQTVEIMRRLDLSQREIEQQFRRTAFNVIGRNQDDHVKNTAFLMDRSGRWSLCPAFDVTYSYNPAGRWTNEHQMSVGGKRDGFVVDDLVAFGRFCNLKAAQARRILGEVLEAVGTWKEIADEAGVSPKTADEVARHHRRF